LALICGNHPSTRRTAVGVGANLCAPSRNISHSSGEAARSVSRYRYNVARLTPSYLAMSLPVCPSAFIRFALARRRRCRGGNQRPGPNRSRQRGGRSGRQDGRVVAIDADTVRHVGCRPRRWFCRSGSAGWWSWTISRTALAGRAHSNCATFVTPTP
jgi:hypothetical protein